MPIPDWAAYQKNFNLVPGVAYYNSLTTTQPATVLMLDKHLKEPLTFKTSASHYYFNGWFRMANAYRLYTWDNFYLYDLNLKRNAEFTTNEGRASQRPASTLTATARPASRSRQLHDLFDFNRGAAILHQYQMHLRNTGAVIEAAAQIGRDGSSPRSSAAQGHRHALGDKW